jgi:hypothetical protein
MSLLDIEFQRRALNKQMVEHFVPAWSAAQWGRFGLSYRLEGGDVPWPVVAYSDPSVLPAGNFYPISYRPVVPDGELGDHDPMQGQVKANLDNVLDAVIPSHECLETRGDLPCDIWIPVSPGRRIAAEASDPVEDTWYEILVDDVEGQAPRMIRVSNFILPAWFVPGSMGPWDYLGALTGPLQLAPGGYYIEDRNGTVVDVWETEAARAALVAKLARPFCRAARRASKAVARYAGIDWRDVHRALFKGTIRGTASRG